MELLSNLGINGKLLLAQIVNFFILLYILKRFAYKPILKVLDDRKEKIEKGLQDAEKAKNKLGEMEEKEKKILLTARKEAQKIVDSAEEIAKKNKEEIIIESKSQAEKILSDTEKKIEEEKNKMLGEVKSEMAELVSLATEKVIGEKMDEEKDREIIEQAISHKP
ncbi:F0F1 ATP synthase subunit B [bacterium]|nr:F0F1 ATP synthase subunit B [bacterium]